MGEPWRRVEKHWCEHCRCWTQGDALSIKHHEGGARHREALQTFLIDARKRKVAERRAADDTQATLAAMAAAAEAAVAEDFRREQQVVAFPPPPPLPPGPPPPGAPGLHFCARSAAAVFRPPAVAGAAGSGSSGGGGGWEGAAGGAEGAAEEEDLGDGTYEVQGRHYLMGEHPSAAALLLPGTACEALWAVDGQWRAATIAGPGREVAVPNTRVRARLYAIEHSGQDGEGSGSGLSGSGSQRFVTELTASSLRLPLSQALLAKLRGVEQADAAPGAAAAAAPSSSAPAAAPPQPQQQQQQQQQQPVLDGATGLGLWETVARPEAEEGGRGAGRRKRARGEGSKAEEEEEEEEEEAAGGGGGGGGGLARARALLTGNSACDPSKALDTLAASARGVGAGGAGVRRGLDAGEGEGEGGQDDALAAFNPHGGALYKGFRLGGGQAVAQQAGVKAEGGGEGAAGAAGAAAGAAAGIVPGSVPVQLAAPQPPAAVFKARAPMGKGRVRGQDD